MEKAKSNRIFELDALRGITALFVVLFHFTFRSKQAWHGFNFGITGVDLFFLISGFVILLTLEKTKSWQQFAINRFSRLYPTYWACVTITTIAVLLHSKSANNILPKMLPEYLANMTMFQRYFKKIDIDGSYWTMIIEMLFYVYMLLIFVFRQLKFAERIAMLTLIPVFFYSSSYFQVHFKHLSLILSNWLPVINHFPLFCAGIIFYKMRFEGRNLKRHAYIIICFICQLTLFGIGGKSHFYISFYEYIPLLFLYFLTFYLYVTNNLGFVVNKTTLFLGNISFSLYLIHQSISDNIIIPFLLKYVSFSAACCITLLVIIFIAYLINKFNVFSD